VVVGTTLSFMAMAYWLVPVLWQKELMFPGLAKWQPYLFGLGMGLASVFMMGAGTLGVPRRHWDMSFADAAMTHQFPASAFMMMGLNGVAALIGGVGGGIFILNMVGTVFFGKAKKPAAAAPETPTITGAATTYGSAGTMAVPGTFVLALVFLTAFVLYYFVNWKYLSNVWGLS
jgi:cytochrome c oxidase subunit 1